MAEPKTRKTTQDPLDFIATLPKEGARRDSATLIRLMKKVTGAPAAMWGPNIVGFGAYPLVNASGRTTEWPVAAFSPRKPNLVMYVLNGFPGQAELLRKLGPHKTGKVCLYLKSLADVDMAVLEEMVARSVAHVRKRSAAKPAAAKPSGAKPSGAKLEAARKVVRKKAATKKAAKRR